MLKNDFKIEFIHHFQEFFNKWFLKAVLSIFVLFCIPSLLLSFLSVRIAFSNKVLKIPLYCFYHYFWWKFRKSLCWTLKSLTWTKKTKKWHKNQIKIQSSFLKKYLSYVRISKVHSFIYSKNMGLGLKHHIFSKLILLLPLNFLSRKNPQCWNQSEFVVSFKQVRVFNEEALKLISSSHQFLSKNITSLKDSESTIRH